MEVNVQNQSSNQPVALSSLAIGQPYYSPGASYRPEALRVKASIQDLTNFDLGPNIAFVFVQDGDNDGTVSAENSGTLVVPANVKIINGD